MIRQNGIPIMSEPEPVIYDHVHYTDYTVDGVEYAMLHHYYFIHGFLKYLSMKKEVIPFEVPDLERSNEGLIYDSHFHMCKGFITALVIDNAVLNEKSNTLSIKGYKANNVLEIAKLLYFFGFRVYSIVDRFYSSDPEETSSIVFSYSEEFFNANRHLLKVE